MKKLRFLIGGVAIISFGFIAIFGYLVWNKIFPQKGKNVELYSRRDTYLFYS